MKEQATGVDAFHGSSELKQYELDAAMFHLVKGDVVRKGWNWAGCLAVGAVGWLVMALPLLVFIAIGHERLWAILPLFVLYFTLRARAVRRGRERIGQRLMQASGLLTGTEMLHVAPRDRERLHSLLEGAKPDLAKAILKILAVSGDQTSLWYAKEFAGRRGEPYLFRASRDATVRLAACQSEDQIRHRLTLARLSGTLLRPAGCPETSALLRPAPSRDKACADELLRPDDSGDRLLREDSVGEG